MDEKQESIAPAMGVAITYDTRTQEEQEKERKELEEHQVRMREEYGF